MENMSTNNPAKKKLFNLITILLLLRAWFALEKLKHSAKSHTETRLLARDEQAISSTRTTLLPSEKLAVVPYLSSASERFAGKP
jgi:hypothetical protein